MITNINIDYTKYTILPIREVHYINRAFPAIEIDTPMGTRYIKTFATDKGLFRKATQIQKDLEKIITEIKVIEVESKEYLLRTWSENNK